MKANCNFVNMLKNFPYSIILGSASPRRQELLNSLGVPFSVEPIHANEEFPMSLKGEEIPLYLSEKKSHCFPRVLDKDELLITSDTIVWHNGRVMNKPLDFKEAVSMLSKLSGDCHEVFTGVCIRTKDHTLSFVEATRVYFRKLDPEEIEFYVKNYPVYDKAGSYGAQDWIGHIGIERIEGSYFNVMGLPIHMLYQKLRQFNS